MFMIHTYIICIIDRGIVLNDAIWDDYLKFIQINIQIGVDSRKFDKLAGAHIIA